MTKKDFFVIIIRLFGLYALILSVFSILPSNISFLAYAGRMNSLTLLLTLTTLIIAFGIMTLLLFKAEKVVSFLKLSNGFDEERMNLGELNSQSVLSLGLIIIGGFLILDNVAWFLNSTLDAFKTDLSRQVLEATFRNSWVISGVNLVIGIILVSNFRPISKILSKKIEKNNLDI